MNKQIKMNFDNISIVLENFGKYQKLIYALCVCVPFFTIGAFTYTNAFLLGVPMHRCALPFLGNDTYELQNDYHRELVERYIPNTDPDDDTLPYDRCRQYSFVNDSLADNSSRSLVKCSKWVYSKLIFKSTFVEKIDLVCDDRYKVSLGTSLFFVGVLFGSIFFGSLSDFLGRKKTLYLSFLLLITTSLAIPWSTTFTVYGILQALIGSSTSGVYMTGYVIGLELVGPSKRNFAGIVNTLFFAAGLVVLAGIAYALRDWFWIQMTWAIPTVFFLSYWFIMPESPRWLISKGRIAEAEAIIHRVARFNKVKLPDKIFTEKDTEEPESANIWHLFRSRVLLIRTLIIFFNWLVVSMAYYGLSLNTGNLGGEFYLNFLISGLVEFPAYTLCILFLDKLGRKRMHCGAMLLGGIGCLCTIFTVSFGGEDLEPLTITLAMIGKLGAAMAFAIIYVFSAELYPTTVRNAGMGASSFCANIGGIIAPYVTESGTLVGGQFGHAVPLVIFGGASVLAGLLSLKLPETLGKNLPETIQDGKTFAKPSNDLENGPGIDSTQL